MKGCRQNEPWRRLLEETGGFQELLRNLTRELCRNFNSDDDVPLSPLDEQEWTFRISPHDVFLQLVRLSKRKANGPDMIPSSLLRIGAQFLCVPLASIFNYSIQSKTYPSCFKQAHVCPIPKCRDPKLGDFRPISLLSGISKIFERLVLRNVAAQLFQCYGRHQHAYRPLSSTATALTEICEHITHSLDLEKISHVNIFCLDLSKAFDKLQHHRLINYLSVRGLNHGFLCWLLSYLNARTFCVKVCNRLGPAMHVPSGVPQGSVLGPFLFAAFMGAFTFSAPNVDCVKYADDVTLIESVSHGEQSSILLNDCVTLFRNEGLYVNPQKCKKLSIRRPRHGFTDTDCGFDCVNTLKILGFTFNETFTWKAQVSEILRLASQRLHVIRLLKAFVTKPDLINVYHAIITSLFLYAAPVYGQMPTTLLSKLEKFQRRGHRMICGDSSCDCSAFPSLLRKLEDAAMKLLRQAETNTSHPLHAYVPQRLPVTNKYRLPVSHTTRRLNSFFVWASRVANSA